MSDWDSEDEATEVRLDTLMEVREMVRSLDIPEVSRFICEKIDAMIDRESAP